ncbi:cilia- and flagella-associated protein 58-like [Euwallacea similis]|uniref:cilia- and flagella-associated protein 58-like n=1 Tax=Euwallacea similis TaxID=1736056 RepID=UPI00344F6801
MSRLPLIKCSNNLKTEIIMNKLDAQDLFAEDERLEQTFLEKMALREHIFTLKSEIGVMEKQLKVHRAEIEKIDSLLFSASADVPVLERQVQELTKDTRKRLEIVLKKEEKLKNLRNMTQSQLREMIQKGKLCLTVQGTEEGKLHPHDDQTQEEIQQQQKRVWALQGEIEALEIILEYQTKKIQEVNSIKQLIVENFPEPQIPKHQ